MNHPFWKRFLFSIVALILSAVLWLSVLNLFFRENPSKYFSENTVSPKARLLLNRHLQVWKDPVLKNREITAEHKSNPEWDFMWRTFFVLAMADISLKEPQMQNDLLPVMEQIINETISLLDKNGMYYFLMEYARQNKFILNPPRSLFHDGEIALMLGVYRLLQDKKEYRILNKKYINIIIDRMNKGKVLSAESYPDECWTFCNIVSLVAIRISDVLDGTDHSKFINKWINMAKQRLIDPKTGLLISAFTLPGEPVHGPEGSTIWMTAHCLSFIDEDFAFEQYQKAKKELIGSLFGFGFSSEWPRSWEGYPDCDAGGLFAISRVSPSASGFALLAGHTFNDKKLLRQILASLRFGGLPVENKDTLKFSASNLVGDAVVLYSLVEGPVRDKIHKLEKNAK